MLRGHCSQPALWHMQCSCQSPHHHHQAVNKLSVSIMCEQSFCNIEHVPPLPEGNNQQAPHRRSSCTTSSQYSLASHAYSVLPHMYSARCSTICVRSGSAVAHSSRPRMYTPCRSSPSSIAFCACHAWICTAKRPQRHCTPLQAISQAPLLLPVLAMPLFGQRSGHSGLSAQAFLLRSTLAAAVCAAPADAARVKRPAALTSALPFLSRPLPGPLGTPAGGAQIKTLTLGTPAGGCPTHPHHLGTHLAITR